MTHSYSITGMTCNGCVAKVTDTILRLEGVNEAEIHLSHPQATIKMQKHIPVATFQDALQKLGSYTIREADSGMDHYRPKPMQADSWFKTYKPVLLVGAYLLVVTVLWEVSSGAMNSERWMRHFMAGFFLVFSFFKLLDLQGFADSYATYDLLARKWRGWGFVYAFVELGLGLGYLLNWQPLLVNGLTVLIMSFSLAGVLKAVLLKQKIQCACLGTVFNLPMSSITIIEDSLMIGMSFVMLLSHYIL